MKKTESNRQMKYTKFYDIKFLIEENSHTHTQSPTKSPMIQKTF